MSGSRSSVVAHDLKPWNSSVHQVSRVAEVDGMSRTIDDCHLDVLASLNCDVAYLSGRWHEGVLVPENSQRGSVDVQQPFQKRKQGHLLKKNWHVDGSETHMVRDGDREEREPFPWAVPQQLGHPTHQRLIVCAAGR